MKSPVNQLVVGSIPTAGAINLLKLMDNLSPIDRTDDKPKSDCQFLPDFFSWAFSFHPQILL